VTVLTQRMREELQPLPHEFNLTLTSSETLSPAPALNHALSLQCGIETQPDYQSGQPVTVTGTVHNAGSSAIWLLSWNTFLEPKWLYGLSDVTSYSRMLQVL